MIQSKATTKSGTQQLIQTQSTQCTTILHDLQLLFITALILITVDSTILIDLTHKSITNQ